MGKSVQIMIISILLIIFLAVQSIPVFAISIEKSDKTSTSGIAMQVYGDGSLDYLVYTTSATGATSGIRYKFTAITIEIDGLNVVIPTKNLTGGVNPSPGVQEFFDITISSTGIIEKYEEIKGRKLTESEKESFNKAFSNPDTINLGAHIEIYNADTGKILETIKSVEEIYSKAAKYGFPKRNLDDMQSRFADKNISYPTGAGSPPETGLRPSVIVDDDC